MTGIGITAPGATAQDTAPEKAPVAEQDLTTVYEAKTLDFAPGKFTLPYRIYKPAVEPGKTYPLIVFLHGAGERGDDNRSHLKHGAGDLAGPLVQTDHPAFVVAPQLPKDRRWAEATWTGADATPGVGPAPEPPADANDPAAAVLALIDEIRQEYPIDETRIYLTGLSMGGFGTWDLIARQPNLFAAAVPICGGGLPATVDRFRAIPIWAFHGDADRAVPVARSREMVETLQKHGAKVRYTEYPGVGHDSWTATYRSPTLYAWLFEQVNPRTVPPVSR